MPLQKAKLSLLCFWRRKLKLGLVLRASRGTSILWNLGQTPGCSAQDSCLFLILAPSRGESVSNLSDLELLLLLVKNCAKYLLHGWKILIYILHRWQPKHSYWHCVCFFFFFFFFFFLVFFFKLTPSSGHSWYIGVCQKKK